MPKAKDNKEKELPAPAIPAADPGEKRRLTFEQIQAIEQSNAIGKIPGRGSLFLAADGAPLEENTRLNEREVWLYTIAYVQEQVATNPNRTESALQLAMNKSFRLKISIGGKGRDDQIILHQLTKDETDKIKGGLFG